MTKVKICGLSEVSHAVAAARSGADFLGLVFAPSRRRVTLAKGREIAEAIRYLPERPLLVGVFVNLPVPEVNQIADFCRLDWVQLSGDESWHYCQDINRPVIKVIHVAPDSTAEQLQSEIEKGCRLPLKHDLICLLDSRFDKTYGGTGRTFDWQLAKEVSIRYRVIVAGGLTPDNVGRLVREVKPWGVDTASGVESNGRKDTTKIEAFIRAVREAESRT